MLSLPDKPASSVISEQIERNRLSLFWKPVFGRYGACKTRYTTFLICFVPGWTVCGIAFLIHVATGGVEDAAPVLLVLWTFGWVLFEIYALHLLWHLLRPKRPAIITLTANQMHYDPGDCFHGVPITPDSWDIRYMEFASSVRQRRKPVELNKKEAKEFRLDRTSERQRLIFVHKAENIEIGPNLHEPEREWLHQVLEAWRTA